jgi:hypothetical protein
MDTLIKWISERLAESSSRRGFFSRMEKMLLAAAALITGQGLLAQTAEAQSRQCCDPTVDLCPSNCCPSGSSVLYTWLCHTLDGGKHHCNDCYDASGNYVCSYMSTPTLQA